MATQNVSEEQLQSQFTYIDAVARLLGDKRPKAYTHTFGCQQNEADTERIRGMLSEMGYEMTDTPDEADFILFNTCAVREHAEDRAFGNVGALRHLKKERPGIVIAMCGCMAQQEKNVEKIKKSYPQVNLLFGTHALWRFPSLLYRVLTEKKRVFDIGGEDDIAEGLPVLRAKGAKAWLSTVRLQQLLHLPHRAVCARQKRSRRPGRSRKNCVSWSRRVTRRLRCSARTSTHGGISLTWILPIFCAVQRRTRHFCVYDESPEDASQAVFRHGGVQQGRKAAASVQSGGDEILHRMNRRYTAEHYKSLIADARSKMPDITLSSDIIVGFRAKRTRIEQTLKLVQDTRFDLLFTFLYSPARARPQPPMRITLRRRISSAASSACSRRRMKSLLKSRQLIRAGSCGCS
ncbi:MAG: tRNA (N6-isopentenyl adenosine(37)-C2)-methylthiotransferase MiaB [Butyricicoccaceae bacterium]